MHDQHARTHRKMTDDATVNARQTPAEHRAHRAEYGRRMNRVLDYIDRHLDQPLELAQLAGVANFSPFHFHRVFAAWMGETLGDYARRRRLEKAAFRLSCGHDESVLETALATGFGSGEAFARAFKLKFDCTPSAWRRDTRARLAAQALGAGARCDSNPDQVLRKFDQARRCRFGDDDTSPNDTGAFHMNVNVIQLPAARVAYHRLIGPYGPGIGAFWRATVAPWIASHGLDQQVCYGIGHDDPSITAPDKCRYDACVSLPDSLPDSGADSGTDNGPGSMTGSFYGAGPAGIASLPGGRYAIARFDGEPAALADAWTWLTRNWLPGSGLQVDDRPCFEMFEPGAVTRPRNGQGPGRLVCDICIPVRPL